MSQVQVPKLSAYIAHGPIDDAIMVPKLSIYLWLEPGDDGSAETPSRQSYGYVQRIRRG